MRTRQQGERASPQLRWGWSADVALAVVVGVLQVGGMAVIGRHQAAARPLDAAGYLLLAAGAVALIPRRRWPVAVLAVVFAFTFGYVLANYPGGPIWAPLIIAFGTALVAGNRIAAYVSLLLGYAGFLWLAKLPQGGPFPSVSVAVGIAAWMLCVLAVSEVVRSRRAYVRESRRRAAEEQRSRDEETRRQASDQRLEIARELHDVLAHSISLINVQAGVALELMDQKPEQVRTALASIKQASKEALVEVQSVLGALRQDDERAPLAPAPSLANIEALVRRADAAGFAVRTQVTGEPVPLPAGVDQAAYRITQEALTNVVRHADASAVVVRVSYQPGELTVAVADDGRAQTARSPGRDGNGIRGMRERAIALGGELEAGTAPGGGFLVQARLPMAGGTERAS